MCNAYEMWRCREIERERRLARLPSCAHCGEKIQDEELIDYEGKLYHEECFLDEYRKWTEDYET